MLQPRRSPARSMLGSLAVIFVVIGGSAAAFAYTAGWLSPERLTPTRLVDAFTPPCNTPPLGHRRIFGVKFDQDGIATKPISH